MASEEKWYALTGRIVDAKVEADGDIHLRFKMPTATTSELSVPRFPLAQNRVRFDKLCSAGRRRSFYSRSRVCTTLQLPSTSSLLRAKRFTTSHWEIIADNLHKAGWSLGCV
jgi:hypothetical protein